MTGLTLQAVETVEDLRRLWPEIAALADRVNPHLCNGWEWHHAALTHFRSGRRLAAILAWAGGDLVAFLPLCGEWATFAKFPAFKYSAFEPWVGLSTAIVAPGYGGRLFDILAGARGAILRPSGLVHLTVDAAVWAELSVSPGAAALPAGALWVVPKQTLAVGGRGEALPPPSAKRVRNEFRRAERRLTERFAVSLDAPAPSEVARDPASVWARFLAVYRDSWKAGGRRSLNQAPHGGFYRQLFMGYAERAAVRAAFLTLDGVDAAAVWWVHHHDVLYGVQTAYREDFRDYGVGAYLMASQVHRLREDDVSAIDLMGAQPYKRRFATMRRDYWDLYVIQGALWRRLAPLLQRLGGRGDMMRWSGGAL